jgi:cyclic pyranopterin phosphate synthase
MSPSDSARRDQDLTHIDEHGHAHMVDVTGKEVTYRRAVARCVVRTSSEAIRHLACEPEGTGTLHDALGPLDQARFAGVQGAKLTSQLIPLCHPLPLDGIRVRVEPRDATVEIEAEASAAHRTGVEMEALTACGMAALTVVTALLPRDPAASIDELTLWHKSGGRSGTWDRQGPGPSISHRPAAPPER